METSEEAAIAFKHAADGVRFLEGQRWSITNHALALQAGIVGTVKLIEAPLRYCWSDVAAMLGVGLMFVAVWLLTALEPAICGSHDARAAFTRPIAQTRPLLAVPCAERRSAQFERFRVISVWLWIH